jgi:hypothetical protein
VPEIADYELRRELIRSGNVARIERLDRFEELTEYLALNTSAMRKAAELWASARNLGQPTADDKALDGDVILAAQVATMGKGGDEPVVVTTNVGHLSGFVSAKLWSDV